MIQEGVPTAVLQPVIERLSKADQQKEGRYGQEDEDFNLWVWLGNRTNLQESTVRRAFERERIDFDLADLILVGLGRVDLWREEPLVDIYLNQKLTQHCVECYTPFEYTLHPPKLYCSRECRHKAGTRRQALKKAA